MSKELTPQDLKNHIDLSLKQLSDFINELSENTSDKRSTKKAMLIAYWIIDYIKLLRDEKNFDPTKLLRYNRGDIVCINFGFRIGSELGGRHFAVVLDNFNSKKSSVITVVPLRSLKGTYRDNCFSHLLNKGIYDLQQEKFSNIVNECKKSLAELTAYKEKEVFSEIDVETFAKKISAMNKQLDEAESLKRDLLHLKEGSIVDFGQIITVSKQRILNPKYHSDTLSKIKVSSSDLDKINEKLSYLYIHQSQKNDDVISPFIKALK